jgi:hypothetical protein
MADELDRMMREARGKPLSEHGVLSPERAEELIAEIRPGRDDR